MHLPLEIFVRSRSQMMFQRVSTASRLDSTQEWAESYWVAESSRARDAEKARRRGRRTCAGGARRLTPGRYRAPAAGPLQSASARASAWSRPPPPRRPTCAPSSTPTSTAKWTPPGAAAAPPRPGLMPPVKAHLIDPSTTSIISIESNATRCVGTRSSEAPAPWTIVT